MFHSLKDWSDDESDENPDLLHVKIVPPKRDDSGIDISADAKSITSGVATTAATPLSMQPMSSLVMFQIGTPLEETSSEELRWLQKHLHKPYWKGVTSNIKLGDTLSSNLAFEW